MSSRFQGNNNDAVGYRGDLDPSYLARLQTNRCAMIQTTGDEATFGGSVLALLAMVPQSIRDELEKEKDDYITEVDDYEFVEDGGWKIGTIERPVYVNIPGTIGYDPKLKQVEVVKKVKKEKKTVTDEKGKTSEVEEEYEVEEEVITYGKPVLFSPKPVKKEVTDYYKLFILIQKKLEEKGLSWKVDETNEEAGRVSEEKKKIPPPTPTLISENKQVENEQEEKDDGE